MNAIERNDPEMLRLLFGHQPKPRQVRVNTQSEPSRPAEDRGLLRQTKDAGLTAVGAIGNVLDLPGSMVRDVLSFQNPLDQVLTPVSSQNRTSGRDLARQFGLAGPRNTVGNAVGGFAAEIALDPLTYLSFGGSALTKAGRVARDAGLMGQLPVAAAQRADRAIGSVGPRTARLTSTLDDVAQASPHAADAVALATQGNAMPLRSQPLGGLVGVGLPFREPAAVLGTGQSARRIAELLDAAEAAIQYGKIPRTDFAPINTAARLFDPAIRGAETPTGQAVAKQHTRGLKELAVDVDREVIAVGRQLESAGMNDAASGERLRDVLEGIRPMEELPEMVRPVAEAMRSRLDAMPAEAKRWGVNLNSLTDEHVAYFPRHLPGERLAAGERHLLDARDARRINREDWLRDIPGGTTAIKRLVADEELGRLLDSGASTAEVVRFLQDKYSGTISDRYRALDSGRQVERSGRFEALAGFVAGLPADVRRAGGFANHPLVDYRERLLIAGRAIEGAKAMVLALSQPGVLRMRAVAGEPVVSVGEMAKQVGLQLEGELAEQIGKTADVSAAAVGGLQVPKVLADDLAGAVRFMTEPRELSGLVQALDDLTNWWKASVTSPWPAFHFRNVVSGQIHNALLGMFSPASLRAAHTMMRGGVVKDAAKIPAVWHENLIRGGDLMLDDGRATEILDDLVARHRVTGSTAGEQFTTSGLTAANDYGVLPEGVAQVLGRRVKPFSVQAAARTALGRGDDTSWLPWDVRGVGGRTKSRFALIAAGEEVGRYGEGLNRIAPFIHQLQRGVNPAEAASRVGAAQALYGRDDVTPFVADVVSRVFPFAKFTLGTAPTIIRHVLERPGGALGQTIRASGQSSEAATENGAPVRVREGASVKLNYPPFEWMFGDRPAGTDRYLSNMGLVHEDLLAFADPGRELGGRLNPALRGPLESLTGTAFHTGGRLENVDPPLGRLLANAGAVNHPGEFPMSLEHLIRSSPASRAVSTAATLADGRPESLFNVLTGMQVSNVAPRVGGGTMDGSGSRVKPVNNDWIRRMIQQLP